MRILFVTDLHAGETCFRKFLNAAKFYEAQGLITGGDLAGKMLVPIVKTGSGVYEATYYGSTVKVRSHAEVERLVKTLRNAGFYTITISEEELGKLTAEDADNIIKEHTANVMKEWMDLATEKLKPQGTPIIMMPGNDDPEYIDEILNAADHVQNGDGKVIDFLGYEVLSLANAIHSPFKYPRDVSEEEIKQKIDALAAQVKDMSKCIFNVHIPPYDTDCDIGVVYKDDLTPVVDGGELATDHCGSKALREAIEKYQPMLCLCGHIHESRGAYNVGRTVCINPGSDYDQGTLKGALINIEGDKVVDYTLTNG